MSLLLELLRLEKTSRSSSPIISPTYQVPLLNHVPLFGAGSLSKSWHTKLFTYLQFCVGSSPGFVTYLSISFVPVIYIPRSYYCWWLLSKHTNGPWSIERNNYQGQMYKNNPLASKLARSLWMDITLLWSHRHEAKCSPTAFPKQVYWAQHLCILFKSLSYCVWLKRQVFKENVNI